MRGGFRPPPPPPPPGEIGLKDHFSASLRLLFVLAMEHTLLRMFLNIWRQILFPGDLHDDAV